MESKLVIEFLTKIRGLDDRNYLFSTIMFHSAPVLARKKPSCLINFTNDKRDILNLWDRYKNVISSYINMDYFELRNESGGALVLFYNHQVLEEAVHKPGNLSCLRRFDYRYAPDIQNCLKVLKERFLNNMPHEIGILLGIPPEDVEGYIKNSGKNFIFSGYWKVYANPESAVRIFREYDNARTEALLGMLKLI